MFDDGDGDGDGDAPIKMILYQKKTFFFVDKIFTPMNIDWTEIQANNYGLVGRDSPNQIAWLFLSRRPTLPYEFIHKFGSFLNWRLICEHNSLTEDFIRQEKDRVDWPTVCTFQRLSESFLLEFQSYVSWPLVSRHQRLSENFMRQHRDRLTWTEVAAGQRHVSEAFLREFMTPECFDNREALNQLCVFHQLSDAFLTDYHHKLDWGLVSGFQVHLSEAIMRWFAHLIDWVSVSLRQPMSEEFIREFQDLVYWPGLSTHIDFSLDFLVEFQDRIGWDQMVRRYLIPEHLLAKNWWCVTWRTYPHEVSLWLLKQLRDRNVFGPLALEGHLNRHHTRVRFATEWIIVWAMLSK